MGLTANIMSLGGIAIAVGALVDAAIVVVEQTHKKLEEWNRSDKSEDYQSVIIRAVKEVGGPSFFALLVIAVSFLPVLTLEAQEGRLFKPLAYTKTLAMIVAAILAITLDPALRLLFTRLNPFAFRPRWLCRTANTALVGTIHPEERHPVSRVLMRLYEPVAQWALNWKWAVIGGACALVLVTIPVYQRLGAEFMPPLDEGALFYMPSTMPGISIGEAQKLLQVTDRIIKQFPEVDRVLGKAGRAETVHRSGARSRCWRRSSPSSRSPSGGRWTPGTRPGRRSGPRRSSGTSRRTTSPPRSWSSRLNAALQIPGVSNAWTMPIKARIDMLTTGVRTPVGLKISGADLKAIEEIGRADRGAPAAGAGHPQRLRRADRGRLLPGHRPGTARRWPATASASTRPRRRSERHRRRERHDDDRGARAVPGERPVPARLPERLRRAGPGPGRRLGRAAADPAGPARHHQGGQRAVHDPERGRAAHRATSTWTWRGATRRATSRRPIGCCGTR